MFVGSGMSFIYRAYGLAISSDTELPSLTAMGSAPFDLFIEAGSVSSKGLDYPDTVKPLSQMNQDSLWFDVPGIARFLVHGGKRITFDPYPNASTDSIQSYLLGSCLAAIFYQRQQLVFRGACVGADVKSCVALLGGCVVGKSTVAAMLNRKGYPLLADDICTVSSDLMVKPGLSHLKLWRNTFAQLGIAPESLKRVRSEIEKYVLPVEHCVSDSPLKVQAMYILTTHNIDKVVLEEVTGFAKFQALTGMNYRSQFVGKLISKQAHMRILAALANQVRLVRVHQPDSHRLEEVVDSLDQDIRRACSG